jgi:hypothetical protein
VLRTPSRLADLQGSTRRAPASVSRGPGAAGGLVTTAQSESSSDDRLGSWVPFMLTRARAHNSRPHFGERPQLPHTGPAPPRRRGSGSGPELPGRRGVRVSAGGLRRSGTVRPATMRSVSATRAGIASAGWQQVKISRRRSSSMGPAGSGGSPFSFGFDPLGCPSWAAAHPCYERLHPDPTPPPGCLSRTVWYAALEPDGVTPVLVSGGGARSAAALSLSPLRPAAGAARCHRLDAIVDILVPARRWRDQPRARMVPSSPTA